jgi:putative SOS response-associated peptidase YedK
MCGRYTLSTPPSVIAEHFQASAGLNFPPRYNIAPTQEAPIVRAGLRGRGFRCVERRIVSG